MSDGEFDAVSCVTASNCVAVGAYQANTNGREPMVVSDSGGTWSAVDLEAPSGASPNPQTTLSGVACVTTTDCSAVGGFSDASGDSQAMAISEDSGAWSQAVMVDPPSGAGSDPQAELFDVACSSAGNCAAVGKYVDAGGDQRAMAVVETSGVWGQATEMTSPPDVEAVVGSTASSVSCVSLGNCTAVGWYGAVDGSTKSFAATETAGVWATASAVTVPVDSESPQLTYLNHVSCSSVGYCTAVGSYDDSSLATKAMAVSEIGGTWSRAASVALPAPTADDYSYLAGISCASAGNCTASGAYDDGAVNQQMMVIAETGGVWTQAIEINRPTGLSSDSGLETESLSCSSAGNCASVGYDGDGDGVVAVESGGTWPSSASTVTPPANGGGGLMGQLADVSCPASGECTAVGSYEDSSGITQALVDMRTAGRWSRDSEIDLPSNAGSTPQQALLHGVSCVAVGTCSTVGQYLDASGNVHAMAVVESSGTWSQAVEVVPPPNAGSTPNSSLYGVRCQSAGSCVAVGVYTDASGNRQLMVASESGAWSQAIEIAAPANAATNPNPNFSKIGCSSTGFCTAVGYYFDSSGHRQALAATEAFGTWARAVEVSAPSDAASNPTAVLLGVSCPANSWCSAVGTYAVASGTLAMQATQSNGSWSQAAKFPDAGSLNPVDSVSGIDCTSVGNCVAVGSFRVSSWQSADSFVESAGTWSQMSATDPVLGLQMGLIAVDCTSSSACTAVGSYRDTNFDLEPMALDATSALAFSASSLPAATYGQPYAATVGVTGGSGQYTWWITGGSLPAGLSLDNSTGVISGTSTVLGDTTFTVDAYDDAPPYQQIFLPFTVSVHASVPSAPSGVSATAGVDSAAVSWTPPAFSGGASIIGYTVTASGGGPSCSATGASGCTVPGLVEGVAYTFTVTANNVAGSSASSAPSNAIVPLPAPSSSTTPTTANSSSGSSATPASAASPLTTTPVTTPTTTARSETKSPPVPAVNVRTSKVVLSKVTSSPIPVACTSSACTGKVVLVQITTIKTPYFTTVSGRKVTRYRSKAVTTVLGTGSFALRRGKSGAATLSLNAAGKRLARVASSSHPVREFLETTVRGGKTMTRAVTVA